MAGQDTAGKGAGTVNGTWMHRQAISAKDRVDVFVSKKRKERRIVQ